MILILQVIKIKMNTLKKKNPHERDHRLAFNSETHTYSTDTCPNFRTVSKVAKVPFKPFKGDWASNETKRGWAVARNLGILMHKTIETGFNKEGEVDVDEKIEKEFDYFLDWYCEKESIGWDIYRTEWKIYDEVLKVAGTPDALFKDSEGKYHIVDWKRCKGINKHAYKNVGGDGRSVVPCFTHLLECKYNEYALQINIYKYILERCYDIKIETMRILNCHPNFDTYKEYVVENMTQEVENLLLPGYVRLHREPLSSHDFEPNIDSVSLTHSKAGSHSKNEKNVHRKRRAPSMPVQLACTLSLLRRRRSARSSK